MSNESFFDRGIFIIINIELELYNMNSEPCAAGGSTARNPRTDFVPRLMKLEVLRGE